jgi:hypothetical protein
MGRKSAMDWKYWGRDRPNWIQDIVEGAFEKVVEPKLKVALNIAAAEPARWCQLCQTRRR